MKKILNKKIIFDVILMILFIIFAGLLSIKFGMDRTWDTRNYHIYNPYAFLTGRLATDIMPAGIQSYFNPLLDIPYYLCIKYLNNHPFIVTFLYGFSYALFLFLIYKISSFIFKNNNKILVTIISVFIASGATMTVRTVGWLSHDTFIADLIFISIYLLIKEFNNDKFKPLKFILAGTLAGASVGLKLTAGIFVLPLLLTCIIFHKQFNSPLKSLLAYTGGMVLGFLITDGFWLVTMYTLFKNPFMPYFNGIFHSPIINTGEVYNVDFVVAIPKKLHALVFFPFMTHSEIRFKLLWILLFINLLTIPFISKEEFKNKFNINIRYTDFISIFTILSYTIWIKTFAVTRYFSPVIGFCVILAFITVLKLIYILQKIYPKLNDSEDKKNTKISFIIISVLLLVTCFPKYTAQFDYKLTRVPIKDNLFECDYYDIPDSSVVLVQHGSAIFIPFLNPKAKYIHFNSIHFSSKGISLFSDEKVQEIKGLLKENKDRIYYITDIQIDQNERINIPEFLKSKEEQFKIRMDIYRYEQKIKNKVATNREIKHKQHLERKLKYIQTHQPPDIFGFTEIELDKLGIDLTKTKCTLLNNNIKNDIPQMQKPLNFYICTLELKNN